MEAVSDDIVKRLRDLADECDYDGKLSPYWEAAAEIERLRSEVAHLTFNRDHHAAANKALHAEMIALRADRDEADEAGATNAENVVRLAGRCDSLSANIRYAAGILDKIVGECAAQADVPKPAEVAYALCYIRALAGSAILDLGLAIGSQARPIFGVDMARGLDKTVTHSVRSGEAVTPRPAPEVYSRPECIFRYCPTEELCREGGCLCVAKPT